MVFREDQAYRGWEEAAAGAERARRLPHQEKPHAKKMIEHMEV